MSISTKNNKLLESKGILTLDEVCGLLKMSHTSIYRLVKSGELTRVSNGLYMLSNLIEDPLEESFAIACKKFGGDSSIAGPTALDYWGLSDSPSSQIWVISNYNHNKNKLYRVLRTNKNIKIGIKKENHFQVTTLERTLSECLYISPKIGPMVGINAIRKAVSERRTTLEKVRTMATKIGHISSFKKYWESLIV